MKTQNQNSSEKKNGLSESLLLSLNALNLSEKITSSKGLNSIFKKDYQDKRLRSKYRNKLISISKIESEGKVIEVQKGLIPMFLFALTKNNLKDANLYFSEIKEICKKVYVAEDKFAKADDYFSGNRSEQTQNILKAFVECAKEFANV